MLTLDHIAIAATDLATGTHDVEGALGLPLTGGGQHAAMGTHNRLLSLGPDEYLEVIAIDPAGQKPAQPRWFDLDDFSGATRATTWICRVPDIAAALAAAPPGAGVPWDLARGDLSWQIAIPTDGKLPFDGLFPALIQWDGPAHPAPRLADAGVRLSTLHLISPQAQALAAALAPLIDDPRLIIDQGEVPAMRVTLATPSGPVIL